MEHRHTQQQGNEAKHQERPEFTPAPAVYAVHDPPGGDVREGVEDPRHQQQGSCSCCPDPRNVRVVDKQEHVPGTYDHAVGGVAGPISEHAEPAEFLHSFLGSGGMRNRFLIPLKGTYPKILRRNSSCLTQWCSWPPSWLLNR